MDVLRASQNLDQPLFSFAKELFPIKRSLTGNGVRKSLALIQKRLPQLRIEEVASGSEIFDWKVPPEWNVKDAYLVTPSGEKICDYQQSSLHLVGYSEPIRKKLSLEELQPHLYSLESQPSAIPYVTSYYRRHWGFCLPHHHREKLEPGTYEVVIESELNDRGSMTCAELFLEGKSRREVLFTTYICHPELANNEISGPVVNTALAAWVESLQNRHYSYRFLFVPETIGSICFLSKNLSYWKKNLVAGFVLTCVGDNRSYSFIQSREACSLADRLARRVYQQLAGDFTEYSFLKRGSDERQYNAPGVELPVVTLMRTKFAEYPEYHSSLDDLSVISEDGLSGSFELVKEIVRTLEDSPAPFAKVFCEPQLGRRGLYPTTSFKGSADHVRTLTNVMAYCDGRRTPQDLAELLQVDVAKIHEILEILEKAELIEF